MAVARLICEIWGCVVLQEVNNKIYRVLVTRVWCAKTVLCAHPRYAALLLQVLTPDFVLMYVSMHPQ